MTIQQRINDRLAALNQPRRTVKMSLVSIAHKIEYDESAEPDYLGKYVQKWQPSAIKSGDNWFISANHQWSGQSWVPLWEHVPDETKAEVIAKYGSLKSATFAYAKSDLKRMDDFYHNRWQFLGIVFKALVDIEINTIKFTHTFTQSLCGIESDDEGGLEDTTNEVRLELFTQLRQMGFTGDEIKKAVSHVP
jgi:hypothetical protein